MLHALLATIGALAMLASIVVKVVMRSADVEEGDAPAASSARGDRPCHRARGRVRRRSA